MSESLRVEGIHELISQIKTLAELKPVQGAIKTVALHLKGKLAQYPEQKHLTRYEVYGQSFRATQRRYFFWALRKGKIEIPYRRGESPGSQTFGRRWTIATSNYGFTAEVGNNAQYGPLLMDEGQQTRYAAKVGWRTVQDVADEEMPTMIRYIQDYVDVALARMTAK